MYIIIYIYLRLIYNTVYTYEFITSWNKIRKQTLFFPGTRFVSTFHRPYLYNIIFPASTLGQLSNHMILYFKRVYSIICSQV